jgi:two-component system OmpR family response regulator
VRILLVEDDAPFGQALREGLVQEGFDVDWATDGAQGVRLAERERFDLVLLDLLLPTLNGFKVCARLREAGDRTPILVLTAKQGEWDETEALDTGADDYLTKPFSFPVLLARIRALLRRHGRGVIAHVQAGDLVLDTREHRCWRGEQEIDLTAREFALLEVLMCRAGEAISKRELLDDVWDFAFDTDSNIVEVYIGYVRRKIDQPFGRQALETVRGVGYRLRADGG